MKEKISLEYQAYGIVQAFVEWRNAQGEYLFFTTPTDIYQAWEPRNTDEKELVTAYGIAVRDELLKMESLLSQKQYLIFSNRSASNCIQIMLGSIPEEISPDSFKNQNDLFLNLYVCPSFTKSSSPWTKTVRLYKALGNGQYAFNTGFMDNLTEKPISEQSHKAFDSVVSLMMEHIDEDFKELYPDRTVLFKSLMNILETELSKHFSSVSQIQNYIGNLFGMGNIYTISMNERKALAEINAYIDDEDSSPSEYLLKWPTKLESIHLLQSSRGTSKSVLVLQFDNGWKSEVRITYPSKKVRPSAISFTFSISEVPDNIYRTKVSYLDVGQ